MPPYIVYGTFICVCVCVRACVLAGECVLSEWVTDTCLVVHTSLYVEVSASYGLRSFLALCLAHELGGK